MSIENAEKAISIGFSSRARRLLQIMSVALELLFRIGQLKTSSARQSGTAPSRELARWLRIKAVALGPTFVKLLQNLSTRADIFPPEYIEEFEQLQDRVTEFSFDEARAVIQEELGRPVEDVFVNIDPKPIAAASIGQIYRVRRREGLLDEVIKVQRPGIERVIELDLAVLEVIVQHFQAVFPQLSRQSDLGGILKELRRTLCDELDYRVEARNTRDFAEIFSDPSERVRVPAVDIELSTRRVLSLEYVPGTKLTEFVGSADQIEEVARILLVSFLKQLVVKGVFHADLHPGNIAVSIGEDGQPVVILYDFGMVGRLSEELRKAILRIAGTALQDDVDGLIEACVDAGLLGVEALDNPDIRQVMQDFIRKVEKLSAESVGMLRDKILKVSEKGGLEFPSEFMLVGRTLAALEGNLKRLQELSPGLELGKIVLSQAQPLAAELFPQPSDWMERTRYDSRKIALAGVQLLRTGRRAFYELEKGKLVIRVEDASAAREIRRLKFGIKSQNALILWLGTFAPGVICVISEQRGLGDSLIFISLFFLERWLKAERRLDG